MNLSMAGELSADYKSGSQRARVVTEAWGAENLYCPNCSSPKLTRLVHNTQASDFSCPQCHFWFQLKGQKTRLGRSIADGAYAAMMRALQTDAAPSYYFMHYEIMTSPPCPSPSPLHSDFPLVPSPGLRPPSPAPAGEGHGGEGEGGVSQWIVRDLLLVPHFAFPPSAIIKRPPLSATARRAGWVGCNFALDRIPMDARIEIISTRRSFALRDASAHSESNQSPEIVGTATIITPPEEVRARFCRIKPLKELSVKERGWTLEVLNVVRKIVGGSKEAISVRKTLPHPNPLPLGEGEGIGRAQYFTNAEVYAFERELAQLHPDNRHVRDKIRQQLQVLRDAGFLRQVERGVWAMK